MPKRFLTKVDRDNLNSFPKEIPYEDIVKYFTISYPDMKQIPISTSEHNKLGFAVQLCSLRYMGFVPDELTSLPNEALNYLSRQLKIEPSCLKDYGKRKKTKRDHQTVIAKYFGFNKITEEYKTSLLKWITDRAMEHNKPSLLLHNVLDKLSVDKIIRPGITTLEEIISIGRSNSNKQTYELLSHILTKDVISFLENILIWKNKDEQYIFSWLKAKADSNTPDKLIDSVEKLDYLKQYQVHSWDLSNINPNRLKFLSHIAKRTNIQAIKRFKDIKKYPVLIAFLHQTLIETCDEVIDIFNACVEKAFNKAKKDHNELKSQTTKRTRQKIKLFKEIGNIILNDSVEDINLRYEIYKTVSKVEL